MTWSERKAAHVLPPRCGFCAEYAWQELEVAAAAPELASHAACTDQTDRGSSGTGQPGAWSTCTVVKYNEGQRSWPVPRLRCDAGGGTLLYRG